MRATLPDTCRGAPLGDRPWQVYVLCDEARRRFSISVAIDVASRAARHRDPSLKPQRPTPRLVLVEAFADRHTALLRMQRLRRWSVEELRRLIDEGNPDWRDLLEAEQ